MRNSIYISTVALAISLSSCQKDDIATGIDPNAVRVTASVGDESDITGTNPNGAAESDRMKFNNEDAISIQTEGQSAIVYTLYDGTWAPASNYLLWKTETMIFNAFYPITDGTFAVPTN